MLEVDSVFLEVQISGSFPYPQNRYVIQWSVTMALIYSISKSRCHDFYAGREGCSGFCSFGLSILVIVFQVLVLKLLTFRIGPFFAMVSHLVHCRVFNYVLDIHPLDTPFALLIIINASRYHQCPLRIG